MKKRHDICIIGACGHVGLPLGIAFASEGLKVIGIDIDNKKIKKVMNKEMPFLEEGAGTLLKKVIDDGNLIVTNDHSYIKDSDHIIIVPGTPIDGDLNCDLSHLERAINEIIPYLTKDQTIILRSTLAPKTTDYVKYYLETKTNFKIGKDIFLTFAPERILQGKAIKELKELPQIVGAYEDKGFEKTKKLFSNLSPKIIRTNPLEAELSKLFTNNFRYVNFALANEYFIIAESLGANIYKIINAVNEDYPRAKIPNIGFTKGPCLGKDSWLLVNSIPHLSSFTGIVSSAFRVNDGLPNFLLNKLKEKVDLKDKKVVILGLTFKKDSDDLRDSLSIKLCRLLKNEFINFETHDPYVDNKDLKKILSDANVVIFAMNHSHYKNLNLNKFLKKGTYIVDIWNMFGKDKFIHQI